MIFIGADFIEFESFESRDTDLTLSIQLFRNTIFFSIPEDINEFVRKYHIELVADLDIREKGAEICRLHSFINSFILKSCFVDFYNGTVSLNLA